METTQLIKLAKFLRDNGADVLNGLSKLTLSLDLLNELNNSFSLLSDHGDELNTSFHVINNTNSLLDIFELQFLHDFVQRATGLKLTPKQKKAQYGDLTKFKNLKLLEINKLNIKLIHGIQTIRQQIQCLICVRCINGLDEILERCGGDETNGLKWSELKEAIFCHNNLKMLDNSLIYAPFLHTLDLSHNQIEDVDLINHLVNLKNLNLSFNRLEQMPLFKGQIVNRLQVLLMRNNFIDDLTHIVHLSNLYELDLSYNCLIEHNSLVPLANLATLQCLNLQGNPLSYHPQHRTKSASYLHDNTATVRFIFDCFALTKYEKQFVGRLHPRTIIKTNEVIDVQVVVKPKRILIRDVQIADDDEDKLSQHSLDQIDELLNSCEHLETKRQIEQLHKEYGEMWLHSQGGSLVQDALGMEKTPIPLSSTPYCAMDLLIHAELHLDQFPKSPNNQVDDDLKLNKDLEVENGQIAKQAINSQNIDTKKPIEDEKVNVEKGSSKNEEKFGGINIHSGKHNEKLDEYKEFCQNIKEFGQNPIEFDEDFSVDSNSCFVTALETPPPVDLYENVIQTTSESSADEDDDDVGDESIYLATIKGENDPIFIVLTKTHIIERECTSTKERTRLSLDTLQQCDTKDDYLLLQFDTLKSDKKQRVYQLELNELNNLFKILTIYIANRPIETNNFKVFKCMKCSSQFGVEKTFYKDNQPQCPTCQSQLVYEDDS